MPRASDGPRVIEGGLHAKGLKIAIVASRFNEAITGRLLSGALDCLVRHGAAASDVLVVRVPGSWEIPVAARRLAMSKSYDAVIGLGALLRGETAHFDLITTQVARGLAAASEQSGVPVIFGVLTAESDDQAIDRSGGKHGNRGWDAAMAAIETANVMRRIARP